MKKKKDEEINDEEVSHFDNVNDEEEEQGQEALDKDLLDVQDSEETNVEKKFLVIIASLLDFLGQIVKTTSPKKASTRLIVTNTVKTSA